MPQLATARAVERKPAPATSSPSRDSAGCACCSQSAGVLRLQRAAGNRAVAGLVQSTQRSRSPQAKLRVGPAGDSYEQEADRVADTVMRMPTEAALTSSPRLVQRKCAECEEEDKHLLRGKPVGATLADVDPDVEGVVEDLRGGGQPLSPSLRTWFEPRFGVSFERVRVHTDARATASARALNARAFTVGPDVVFDSGQYSPDTDGGRRLIAHELTHVVQQGSAVRGGTDRATPSSTALATVSRSPANVAQREVKAGATFIELMIIPFWGRLDDDKKAIFIDQVIDWMSEHTESLPGKNLFGALWAVVKPGLLGFFARLKSSPKEQKITAVNKIVNVIAGKDEAFTWAFLKGLLHGFFIDGMLGIFMAIVELLKAMKAVWDFLKDIGDRVGGFIDEMTALIARIAKNGDDLLLAMGSAMQEVAGFVADKTKQSMFANFLAEQVKAYATKAGESIATSMLDFFSKPDASAEMGEAVGKLSGMAMWEVVFLAITEGAGAVVDVAKEGISVLAKGVSKVLSKAVSGILKVVDELRLLFSKIGEAIKGALKFVKGKLSEIGEGIAKFFEEIGNILKRLFEGCVEHSPISCPKLSRGKGAASVKGGAPIKGPTPPTPPKAPTPSTGVTPTKLPPGPEPPPQVAAVKQAPLPEGFEDLFEQVGMGTRPTPGGKLPAKKLTAGQFIHKYADLVPDLIKQAVRRGDKKAAELIEAVVDWPKGVKPNVKGTEGYLELLAKHGKLEPDGVSWAEKIVYELKPKTSSKWTRRGKSQLAEYVEQMNKGPHGPGWTGKNLYYDQDKLLEVLTRWGVLEP